MQIQQIEPASARIFTSFSSNARRNSENGREIARKGMFLFMHLFTAIYFIDVDVFIWGAKVDLSNVDYLATIYVS